MNTSSLSGSPLPTDRAIHLATRQAALELGVPLPRRGAVTMLSLVAACYGVGVSITDVAIATELHLAAGRESSR